jgi:hypothetical protein
MKIALICIATGEQYWPFAKTMIRSAKKFFYPEGIDVFLFSDCFIDSYPADIIKQMVIIEPKGFPKETLFRYHTMLILEKELETYDQIFWVDADMEFVAPVGNIYSQGITATLHPGYPEGGPGVPESTRPQSTAYLVGNKYYFCGGFNGGNAQAYLKMARTLRDNIDKDLEWGCIAIHNDESHLNHYLHYNPPAKILTPAYCYPEPTAGPGYDSVRAKYQPILVAREKGFQK